MKRLLVIGGGITGLSAAWRARSLSEPVEVTLLEKERRLGGKILTEHRDGFVLEAGADGFLSRKPAGMGLCEELGITGLLRGQVSRKGRSFVMRSHELHPMPEGFSGMVPENLQALQDTQLLSREGKLRAMEEVSIPARTEAADESVSRFMTRRFGSEVFDALIEPLLAGIYAGDAACLSMEATFPKLRELERRYGSILKGLRGEQASPPRGSPFVTLRPGMAELARALSRGLGGIRLLTGVEAAAITPRGALWRVELAGGGTMEADALIVTVPAGPAAKLLSGVDADLAQALASIPFASSAIVHLAFPRDRISHDLDGYGYVIPRKEGSDILACTWTSSKWEERAPRGMVLIRVYAGRHGGPDMAARNDNELEELARGELRETMGIDAAPLFARVFRWPNAMPQYTLDHARHLQVIGEKCAGLAGLFLPGASYRGVGIPDCIESGYQAARAAVESLA